MFKIDMLFSQQTNKGGASPDQVKVGGWSEGWYVDADQAGARAVLSALCPSRAALLTSSARIVGQRVRQVGGGSQTAGQVFPGTAVGLADVPQMALEISCGAVGKANVRHFRMRGVADARVVEGAYVASDAAVFAFNSYKTAVDQLSLRFKGLKLDNPRANVISVDTTGNVVTATDFVVTLGQNVKTIRVKGANGRAASGIFPVIARTDNTHFQLGNWKAGASTGGSVRLNEIDYFLADGDNFFIEGVTLQKVGRPFHQFRGRRSTRH